MTGLNAGEPGWDLIPGDQAEIELVQREAAAIKAYEKLDEKAASISKVMTGAGPDIIFGASMRAGGEELLAANANGEISAQRARNVLVDLQKRARALQAATEPLIEMLTREIKDHGIALAAQHAAEHEQRRNGRISEAQQQRNTQPTEMGRKCSKCGKKPARVDDLCKICAREAGILIHGKIGGV